MSQTIIVNPDLKAPWLLISAYEVAFDNYLNVGKRYQSYSNQFNNHKGGITWQMQQTLVNLNNQLKGISEQLRSLDEKIHHYIKTHQQ